MESDIKKRRIRIVGLDRLTDDREDKNGNRRVRNAEIRVPIVRGRLLFILERKLQNSKHISGVFMYVELRMRILGWLSSRSHYLRLNHEENDGRKSLKRPVIVESFNEIVFPDPFESFIARVHNHPAVWISKLPKGFNVPPPGIGDTYHPSKKGDTKDHPLNKWFFRFSEAKELSKIKAARQQVQVQIAKLKQHLDGGLSEELLPHTTTMKTSTGEKAVNDAS